MAQRLARGPHKLRVRGSNPRAPDMPGRVRRKVGYAYALIGGTHITGGSARGFDSSARFKHVVVAQTWQSISREKSPPLHIGGGGEVLKDTGSTPAFHSMSRKGENSTQRKGSTCEN